MMGERTLTPPTSTASTAAAAAAAAAARRETARRGAEGIRLRLRLLFGTGSNRHLGRHAHPDC
jgi:hypothetical protein